MKIVRIILSVILGYLIMVALITVVQEGIFGGVSYYDSSLLVLGIAGAGTVLSGTIGAYIASWVANNARVPSGIMAVLVMIETVYLLSTGILSGPLWFELLAGASLASGILLGGILWLKYHTLIFPNKTLPA